jgi:catechol 2,3-dioxygenase-like lactoylglutathione lyase family enzyme
MDHVVIAVHNLEQAMADYRQLGFNPFYGGVHAGGKTHNALIVFQDGTYLELLAPTASTQLDDRSANDRSSFLFLLAQGEGLAGYALQSPDLEADASRIQAAGIDITLRPPAGRARPDGQQLQWRSATIQDTMSPFLIQDLTPRVLRVPDDPQLNTHANGSTGLMNLQIVVHDLQGAMQFYEALLGSTMAQVPDYDTGEFKSEISALSSLRQCPITITQPIRPQGELVDSLQQYGEVPFALTLRSTAIKEVVQELDRNSTHGARIKLALF